MKKSIITLCLALSVATNLFASDIQVDGIWYDFNDQFLTASVTYEGFFGDDGGDYTGSVVIPASVSYNGKTYSVIEIGSSAFCGCHGLTSVTIPNSVTTIEDRAFSGCSGLTSVTIPNSVTLIGDFAFAGCIGLTSITIPNSVTAIGEYTFTGCSNLTSVTINSDAICKEYIIGSLFGDQVKEYIIGNSVTTIRNGAFSRCYLLTSIIIPNSVTTIGDYAFRYCHGLTSVTIGNSVTTIGNQAFYDNIRLKTVYNNSNLNIVKGSTNYGYVAYYADNVYNGIPCGDFVIKDDTIVGGYLGQATNMTIPDDIKQIGNNAFEGRSDLTTVTIPNSVTTIGDNAFEGCRGLTIVTIPKSVTTIGNQAFYECINLEEVKGCQNVAKMGSDVFGNTLWYLDQPNGLLYIGKVAYEYKGDMLKDTHITIKDGTLGIASRAFYNCSGLTSITFPHSVTTIGSSAFEYCKGLTIVTIPKSITTIEMSAFSNCRCLTKTNYTGTIADWCKIKFGNSDANPMYYSHNFFINDLEVKDLVIPNRIIMIGDNAFYKCTSLNSVTIGNSVKTIGNSAFSGCSGLTSITIPNSVTTIGNDAFFDCSKLTSVTINSNAICSTTYTSSSNIGTIFGSQVKEYTIGNSVTTIGDDAFFGCNSLTSITIPNSVTTIGGSAFSSCSGLTSITIPNSVTTIGSNAFNNCPYLKKIVCEIEKPLAITDDVFSTYSGILYVPAKGVNRYKLADGWKKFRTILPIQAEEVIVTETQVNPSANIVSIAWRAVENAYNYIIVIKQGEDTICKMTFNAEGQLVTSQYYAPQRARLLTSTTDAEQTATGWRYVIRDLEPGTEYTYSIVAYDETDKAIDSQSGTFRTLLPSGLEDLTIDKKVGNKFIYGNQLYLRRGDKIYNAVGGAVR